MIFICKKYAREGGLWIFYAWTCFCFAFLCRITQEHCRNCSWFFMKKIYSGYKFSIMRGIFQFPVHIRAAFWCSICTRYHRVICQHEVSSKSNYNRNCWGRPAGKNRFSVPLLVTLHHALWHTIHASTLKEGQAHITPPPIHSIVCCGLDSVIHRRDFLVWNRPGQLYMYCKAHMGPLVYQLASHL